MRAGYLVFRDLEHAPTEGNSFLHFAAALCVRHAPVGDHESYEADLRIALRDAYHRKFAIPDDPECAQLVDQLVDCCVQLARIVTKDWKKVRR